jgi:diguanylate cyclase (GGDEF)-like protein
MGPNRLDQHLADLQEHWNNYRESGEFDRFIEFALTLNSLAVRLSCLRLPGLVRQCEFLESTALSLFGTAETHPVADQHMLTLESLTSGLLHAIAAARRPRNDDIENPTRESVWGKSRVVWIISPAGAHWAQSLANQFAYFGFRVRQLRWDCELPDGEAPIAVIFLPATDSDGSEGVNNVMLKRISRVRLLCPTSQMFYIGVQHALEPMVTLMRAGIDVTLPRDSQQVALLSRILDLVRTHEQERYRVLIVEDSKVAAAAISKVLVQHDIDCHAVADLNELFAALSRHRPDLILMDMHMPNCNGVEATRALRQLPAYQATPIIYLSAETDVGMQVEALRLGGDQFLTKPFNPVLLAATVRTTVERHREMRRVSHHDGLTGLLNHSASKAALDARLAALAANGSLSVVMIDIDNFKTINDLYGHPVGDQVIRHLAWLLKGRLRTTDVIGRYGGEEFIVAIAESGPDEAHRIIDWIRACFKALPQSHPHGTFTASFSAGVASWPDYDTTEALIHAADTALLEAKRLGRDRVESAPMQAGPSTAGRTAATTRGLSS